MKKIKRIIFSLLAMFVLPLSYDAASASLSFSCPATTSPGAKVTCTIKATTSAANAISGIQAEFDFGDATYVSNTIKDNDLFDMPNSITSKGFMSGNKDGLPATFTVGKVTVKIPSTAQPGDRIKLGLTNIKATDKATYADINVEDVSDTVKIPSTDNTLSVLTISEGTLTPAFDAATTAYTATVEPTVKSVVINAVANDSSATVSGTGTKSLDYGDNKFTISVKSESGVTKKYVVTITRTDDRDTTNTLKSLSVKGMSMKPTFAEATTDYTLSVDASVTKVTIEAALKSDKSSFVKNYGPRSVDLDYGENKVLVKVKAENEKIKTYTITITRKDDRSKNNNLKNLTVSVGTLTFEESKTSYTITVPRSTTSVEVGAELADEKAKFVKNYGPRTINITKDETKVLVKVQAENEETKTYTVVIKKDGAVSSNANISNITLSSGAISIEPGKTTYDVEVDSTVNEFSINVSTEDPNAKAVVDGPTTLKKGMNKYTVTVTAENGDKVVYTINVNKSDAVLSDNTNIQSIMVGGNQVNYDEASGSYVVTVDETKTLDLTVTLEDTNATYQISGNENLINGSVIKINVIAQNGTLKEYSLKVNFNEGQVQSGALTSDMLLYVAIGVALIIVIIIIGAVVSKKKKGKKDATVVEGAADAPSAPAVETPAPVVETPTVETPAPVVETPAVETPAVETPAVETPAGEAPVMDASPVFETPSVEVVPEQNK